MSLSDFGPALDIHYITRRVTNRFAEKRLSVFINQACDRIKVIGIYKAGFNTLTRKSMSEQIICSAVELRSTDNIAANLCNGFDSVTNSCHA